MKKVPVKTKIFDTLFLAIVIVITSYVFESALLRWLMELGFVMSLGELFLTAYTKRQDLNDFPHHIFPKESHYIIITNCIIAIASVCIFFVEPEPREYILFFAAVISADAGGLFFGRLFGHNHHPWFSRNLSPNKTWMGYLGEFIVSWSISALVIYIFKIPDSTFVRCFVALAPLFGACGDLCASGAKRQLCIKDSSEVFRNMPILGSLEWFIKSRDGFLDCFDSIASAFIYFTITYYLFT